MPVGGGRDAPLAVQAEQLKKSQARRAERRRAARGRSLAARLDFFPDAPRKGGTPLFRPPRTPP